MVTERESVDAIQQALGVIKANLANIESINTQAGNSIEGEAATRRLDAAVAAMEFRGKVITLHAKMTFAMREYWPEFANEVQTQGPGR